MPKRSPKERLALALSGLASDLEDESSLIPISFEEISPKSSSIGRPGSSTATNVQKYFVVVPSSNSPSRRYQLMLLMMTVMTVKICFAGFSGTDDGAVAAGAVLDRDSSPND
ncbi:uncharacterized protein HKW66_Vig0200280 [Vigna angularis]|uniref:Uncharacterized protein n=1 Tax=Phaseolus angularis TaxID=3914 RepID=A0A8T0JTY3_PHAAN|nr:uncharacterized protein HKW66_Vig0200270 [Vigna angularis]KAG2380656.1 uncharacterized protein HKW66_Vig0200280 [Vigna angularis]